MGVRVSRHAVTDRAIDHDKRQRHTDPKLALRESAHGRADRAGVAIPNGRAELDPPVALRVNSG